MTYRIPLTALTVTLALAAGCNNDNGSSRPLATGFVFSTMPASSFQRVDRVGQPLVATAVITSKDAYNAANPANDVSGTFTSEISANITDYHTDLDAELIVLGLDPATTMESLAQASPLIMPDVLTLDPTQPAGFPNGRRLTDPTPDEVLAVVLLDLTTMGQTVSTFANLPLNPTANDKTLSGSFPYLARPHTP